MRRLLKWVLIISGSSLMVGMAAAVWYLSHAGPIGSGFVAKYLCSAAFISHRDPQNVFEQDVTPVNPIAGYFNYTIENEKQKVTTDFNGFFERTAIYREGSGCTLVIGNTEDRIRKQLLVTAGIGQRRSRHREDRPWPNGNGEPIDPELLGIDANKLEEAVDMAFADPSPDNRPRTRAVVVAYKGHLVVERYADGFNRELPLMG